MSCFSSSAINFTLKWSYTKLQLHAIRKKDENEFDKAASDKTFDWSNIITNIWFTCINPCLIFQIVFEMFHCINDIHKIKFNKTTICIVIDSSVAAFISKITVFSFNVFFRWLWVQLSLSQKYLLFTLLFLLRLISRFNRISSECISCDFGSWIFIAKILTTCWTILLVSIEIHITRIYHYFYWHRCYYCDCLQLNQHHTGIYQFSHLLHH